jgi:hypothetical protein
MTAKGRLSPRRLVLNRFLTVIYEELPHGGKNLLTNMPQRVIFSSDLMPHGGKRLLETTRETPEHGRKDARS